MNNPTLAKKYLRLAFGGNMDEEDQANFTGTAATVAGVGSGVLDAFDSPNEYGNQSVGTTAAKSALSFGAAGASVGGPVGAGIGAALGLGVGLAQGFKARKQERGLRTQKFATERQNEMNRSASAIASDGTLVTGYKNAQMFAAGGTMSSTAIPSNVSSDKSLDSIPDYLYYLKAVQNGNTSAANKMVGHLTGIRGADTVSRLQFLGKDMQHSNVFDLAKRNVSKEQDPEMRRLYGQLNENPDLFNKFEFAMDDKPVAVRANGGSLYQQYKSGGVLPPVTVVTHKDKETRNFYKNLQQTDPYSYSAFMDMGKKYGFPKIRKYDESNSSKRGEYNVLTNTIKIAKNRTSADTSIYMDELAHKIQVDNDLPGFIGKQLLHDIPDRILGKDQYMDHDAMEYEAHRKIAPKLKKEFENNINTSPEYIPMKKANGGSLQAPLTAAYMNGGHANSLSSDTTELKGNSHAQGGIDIPQLGAEVEGQETTAGDYVFSKQLGFAKLHKPIARMKGVIEKKPQTPERVNAMRLLNGQENKLKLSQEFLKQQLGIQ